MVRNTTLYSFAALAVDLGLLISAKHPTTVTMPTQYMRRMSFHVDQSQI
jgi:hypothetical protein